jgi:hypothetical protein
MACYWLWLTVSMARRYPHHQEPLATRRAPRNEIADGRQDRRRSAMLGLMASVSRPAAAIGYVASGHEPPPDFGWDRAIAEIRCPRCVRTRRSRGPVLAFCQHPRP